MLAAFGVDVLDPGTSLRRVHVLLDRLPAGSWPDQESGLSWSTEAHLLAAVVDSLGALVYITLKAHGAKHVRQPKPLPRPAQAALLGAVAGGGRRTGNPAQGKTRSWGDAAKTLAAMPGVVSG
jgi:hypothetical protein